MSKLMVVSSGSRDGLLLRRQLPTTGRPWCHQAPAVGVPRTGRWSAAPDRVDSGWVREPLSLHFLLL